MTSFVLPVLIFLVLAKTSIAQEVQSGAEAISDPCIGCICYGSTGCTKDAGCRDADVCGPLLISWAYWVDGGKFYITGTDPLAPNAYQQCARDTYCAAATVRGYMAKYARDCNGDGKINCEDYARIHKRGPGACTDKNILETKFYKDFATCSYQLRP